MFRIFTGSIIGMISGIALLVVGVAVAFVVVVRALAVSGSPGDCTPGGGPIVVDAANSAAFKQKWKGFNEALDAGSPSAVTLTESEISRARTPTLRRRTRR